MRTIVASEIKAPYSRTSPEAMPLAADLARETRREGVPLQLFSSIADSGA